MMSGGELLAADPRLGIGGELLVLVRQRACSGRVGNAAGELHVAVMAHKPLLRRVLLAVEPEAAGCDGAFDARFAAVQFTSSSQRADKHSRTFEGDSRRDKTGVSLPGLGERNVLRRIPGRAIDALLGGVHWAGQKNGSKD